MAHVQLPSFDQPTHFRGQGYEVVHQQGHNAKQSNVMLVEAEPGR